MSMNELAHSLGLPSFKLELTFEEGGTVYAALMLAAENIRDDGKNAEAVETAAHIQALAGRLLPGGNAAVYSLQLSSVSDPAQDMTLSIDDVADIYAALMTVATLAHSAGAHDDEHRLQGLAERFLNASAVAN